MARLKKFIIAGLNTSRTYKESAPIVLDNKLRVILKEVDRFFNDDSVENLHSLRIAFRRFRYVMEIFQSCFEKELFNKVYNYVKEMQDLIGEGRDLDVLEMKARKTESEINKKIPNFFYDKINQEKREIRQTIKMEMIKFIIDKDVNKFLINKKRG